MALQATASVISAPASTGASADTSIGWQPKGMLSFYGNQTATGSAAHAHIGIGMTSSGAEDLSHYFNSKDASASSAVVRSNLTTAFLKTTVEGATTARCTATMTSLDATGFTTNFSATVSGAKFPYLAIGGSDVTNSAAGQVAMTTGTTNFSVTGLSFQPDIVFLSVVLLTTTGTASNNNSLSFGVAKSTSARWAVGIKSRNAQATMNTSRAFTSDSCLIVLQSTGDTIIDKIDFVSFNSDGFTLSHPTASGSAYLVNYLCFKGGQWKVGNFSQATSTGNQSTTGVGFQPVGVLFAHASDATDQTGGTGATATARIGIGAATSSTNRQAIWMGDEDAAADSKCDSRYATDKCILMYDEAGGGAPTALAEADYVSNDSDGFTINWSTADATARKIGYVAFGSNASAANTSAFFQLF